VVTFNSLDEIKEYREAIKQAGLNVNDCSVLAIVANKQEKSVLTELFSVTYVSDKEFGLLGRLKNEEVGKLIEQNFDLMVINGDISKRMQKLLKRKIKAVMVGVNSSVEFLTIHLNTEDTSPVHLISFVKNMLLKIN
jgi:hypothetical protein